MCAHGDEVALNVLMPAHLSYTGEARWTRKGIDRCIAPIVQALNDAGVYTANCCCGHGEAEGTILLHDGRELRVLPAPPAQGWRCPSCRSVWGPQVDGCKVCNKSEINL